MNGHHRTMSNWLVYKPTLYFCLFTLTAHVLPVFMYFLTRGPPTVMNYGTSFCIPHQFMHCIICTVRNKLQTSNTQAALLQVFQGDKRQKQTRDISLIRTRMKRAWKASWSAWPLVHRAGSRKTVSADSCTKEERSSKAGKRQRSRTCVYARRAARKQQEKEQRGRRR